jgi:antitoxin HicB
MLTYGITLEQDTNRSWLATCAELPEMASVGDDEQEALLNAIDAIETAIQGRISDRQAVPFPERVKRGRHPVTMPAQVTAKVLLHNEMLRQNIRKAELARRLGVHMPQVDRLLNPRHASRLEMIEAALQAVGRKLELRISPCAK